MVKDKDNLTDALRESLELIYKCPAALTGPQKALANKLWKKNLVELDRGIYRITEEGRRVLGVGLSEDLKIKVELEVMMMLHAHRDCLRNQKQDTGKVTFDVRDGYYGEAFGILRCLQVLGYGKYGPVNIGENLNSWMHELERRVLQQENYDGSNKCDHCLQRYGKDGAGRKKAG